MTLQEILKNHSGQYFRRKGHKVIFKVNNLDFIVSADDQPVSLKAKSVLANDWEFVL